MTLRRFVPSFATLACAGLLALAGSPAMAATDPESAAADYCRSTGGVSSVVHPYSNTNADPRQWVRYGGSAIDAWGPACHSASIVRGIDLSTALKFANPY